MTSLLLTLFLACGEKTQENASASATANAAPPAQTNASEANTSDDAVVATWNGGSMKYGEALEPAKGRLAQMRGEYLQNRYDLERQSLEQAIIEKILEAEAAKKNLASTEDLLKQEIESKTTEPQEAELKSTYEQVKARLRGMDYETAKPMIAQQLKGQQQQELFMTYIEDLKKSYDVKITLPYPEVPRVQVSADDDPYKGPETAPITIIQFAEFQCPYCGKAGEAVEQVMKEYDGKVKMVFRDFPLSFHDRAIPAAVAANCAGEQNKYWEMHDQMMANQRSLSVEDLKGYATNIGLDIPKWELCLQDPKQEEEVKKDMDDGSVAGVSGTPAFFINGIMLSGALPFERFKEVIDRELAEN